LKPVLNPLQPRTKKSYMQPTPKPKKKQLNEYDKINNMKKNLNKKRKPYEEMYTLGTSDEDDNKQEYI
jgi:hypothetical protein